MPSLYAPYLLQILMSTHQADTLYAKPLEYIADFTFDDQVAKVFDDMIQRSVPGYDTIVRTLGVIAERYAQPNSRIYDLGCSLGAGTLVMRRHVRVPNCTLIAVDNAPAMLEKCQALIAAEHSAVPVETRCADIREVPIERASLVVLNFTLQFVPLENRLPLLQNIHQGLLDGGVLLLSEKIALAEHALNARFIELHHAFKRANGYSDLEISQKRTALEKVLLPDTLTQHQQRLQEAGFQSSSLWFQCFNFVSLLAWK